MTTPKPTLAYWRRRALRAEAEVESLRQIRQLDHKWEASLARQRAMMRVALEEISEVLGEWRALDAEARP